MSSRAPGVGVRSPRQIVWRPAASWGGAIGVGLCVAALVAAGALGMAWASTSSQLTRLVITLLEIPILAMVGTCLLGTWRWITMCYALAPTALEIRHGTSRLRIRYEDVTCVARAELSEGGGRVGLWPGAPAGDEVLGTRRVARWWGTSRRRADRVVVESSAGAVLLTPAEPESFCEALWSNVRAAAAGVTVADPPARGWLELIADADGWFRGLMVLAFAVATIVVVFEVMSTGTMTRQSTVAAFALMANSAFGTVLLARSASAARILMAATLAYQGLGVLL